MRGNAAMNQIAQKRAREKLDDLRREKDAERARQTEEIAWLKRFHSPQIADLMVSSIKGFHKPVFAFNVTGLK